MLRPTKKPCLASLFIWKLTSTSFWTKELSKVSEMMAAISEHSRRMWNDVYRDPNGHCLHLVPSIIQGQPTQLFIS
jgi:hypothetical protein